MSFSEKPWLDQHRLEQVFGPEATEQEVKSVLSPEVGLQYDEGKTDLTLVEPDFIAGVARILEMGAVKYERDNWRKGIEFTRVLASCMRHLQAWQKGEENDLESGENHLYHAACRLMMLAEYTTNSEKYGEFDDRIKKKA